MSDEARIKDEHDAEGLLTSAAQAIGHAAGAAAKTLGLAGAVGPEVFPNQGGSLRARRISEAAAARNAAAALGKNPFPDDVRYRRIMGKKPAIWSREDVDYVAGLVSAKRGSAS